MAARVDKNPKEPEPKEPEPKEPEPKEPEPKEPEPKEPETDTDVNGLRDMLGEFRSEMAEIRKGMAEMHSMFAALANQQALAKSIAAEGNPGESGEEDYPEIDLDEIARMTGDM